MEDKELEKDFEEMNDNIDELEHLVLSAAERLENGEMSFEETEKFYKLLDDMDKLANMMEELAVSLGCEPYEPEEEDDEEDAFGLRGDWWKN